jgi:hypothetical protein
VPVVVDLVVEQGRLPASSAVLRGLLGQLIADPPGCHGSGFKPYRSGQLVTVYGRVQSWRLAFFGARRRRVWAFVMVLCCSRHMFVRPTLVMDQRAWTETRVEAFAFFGGVPRAS